MLPAYINWLGPWALGFSPDGKTLAYGAGANSEIVLWNTETQQERQRLRAHREYASALDFSGDGRMLASADNFGSVWFWDLPGGTPRPAGATLGFGYAFLRFSPDGKTLAAAGQKDPIVLFDSSTGEVKAALRGHDKPVTSLAFSPDGQTLVSASFDGTVRVWESDPHPEARAVPIPPGVGYLDGGVDQAVLLSPDATHLLTVFTNDTFILWHTSTLSEGPRLPVPVTNFATAAVAPGGATVAFAGQDGNIVFWHPRDGRTEWVARPQTNSYSRLVFSLDGRRLAAGSWTMVSVLDTEDPSKPVQFPAEGDDATMVLNFSVNRRWLTSGYFNGPIRVWDLETGRAVRLTGLESQCAGLAVLSDNRTLISAGMDLRFWDLDSQTELKRIDLQRYFVHRCALSRDGRRLAVGTSEAVSVWDTLSQQELLSLKDVQGRVRVLGFLPDNETLVAAGTEELRLWRAAPVNERAPGPVLQAGKADAP
jgi:WD40 repeat protein